MKRAEPKSKGTKKSAGNRRIKEAIEEAENEEAG